jgi:hypothetical protein
MVAVDRTGSAPRGAYIRIYAPAGVTLVVPSGELVERVTEDRQQRGQ